MHKAFMNNHGKNRILILLGLLSLSVTMIILVICRFMYSVIEDRSFTAMVDNTTEMLTAMRDITIENVVFHLEAEKREIADCARSYGDSLMDGGEDDLTAALAGIPLPEYGIDYVLHRRDGKAAGGRGTDAALFTPSLSPAWSGETIVDGPVYRGDGAYTMAVSTPVYQDEGIEGVLTVVLDGFCLSEWISDIQFPSGGGLSYIVNQDGTNIAVSTEYNRDWVTTEYNAQEISKTNELITSVAELEAKPLNGLTGAGSYVWEGSRNYLVYAPVPGTGWGLFVGFYGATLHQYAREITFGGNVHNQAYLAVLVLALCILSIVEIRWIGKEQKGNKILTEQKDALIALQKKTDEQAAQLKAHHDIILSSLEYAKKIQRNLLPDPQSCQGPLSELGLIWNPKDAVGGDLYWIKHFPTGSLLCVCDCTGHGVPGAMLTMLAATALDAIVNETNCQNPAAIMWQLERRLVSVLNTHDKRDGRKNEILDISEGADLALIYADRDNGIQFASGNTHVFVCNGEEVTDFKGQRLRIGEGALRSEEQIKTVSVPADKRNRYYAASDGYFDQIGQKNKRPFGYGQFKRIILEHHNEPIDQVMDELWTAFEEHRGTEERRDDVELMGFRV